MQQLRAKAAALMMLITACALILPVHGQTQETGAQGELPPLIDRELFFGDPQISGSQLSPDGNYLSFIKPYKGVRNIYVKGLEEPFEAARPVTADERPVPSYFWSQDSRFLLYVQDKGGNENFHVYAVNPADQPETESGVPPARDLTPLEDVRAVIYAVPKNKPGEMIVGLNDREPAYHDVYRVDIATGERELLIQNTEKVGFYIYDLEGNVRLAYRQMPSGDNEILRIDGDSLTQVYTCSWQESCFPIQFHQDGKRVYLESNKGAEVNLSRLVLFDPQSGKEEVIESDPENQVDFGGAVFSDDTDELIATYYEGDRIRIYPKEKQFKKDYELLRKKLPEGELSLNATTRDMQKLLVAVSRDVDPGSVYLYDRKSGEVTLQYRSRPELPSEHLATMKAIRYKARDGMEIPAYLTLPKGIAPKNLPVVIHPHGGPWARDNWGYDGYAQFLANRGYAVLQPNFRGSTGYGKKFLNAGNQEWGTGAMQHDITDGVQYLIDERIADPKRIAIFGGSYGGYATLAGVTFTPDLYAAGIPYVAPSNLVTLIESFPAYWGPFIKTWHLRVGDPANDSDKADLIARSPLFKAEQIKAPLLVIHGANDPRVTQAESDQLVVALRDRGVAVEYVVAPDEGHGFRAPENRLAAAVAMEEFLAKHIGGRYQEEVSEATSEKLAALMIDVQSVKLQDKTLVAFAETAPLPQRVPAQVQPMSLQYKTVIESRGQQMEMTVSRHIAAASLEGQAAWRIISVAQSPMMNAADTFYVEQETLLPMRRSATQGPAVIKLRYDKESVSGSIKMGAQENPIAVKLPAPVFGDGAAIELALAALPLAEGYETTIRYFDPITQKVRLMSLQVVGSEAVMAGAGTFESFKVQLAPLDGNGGGGTMLMTKQAPRCMVRSMMNLPAAMGGGTSNAELISTGTAAPN